MCLTLACPAWAGPTKDGRPTWCLPGFVCLTDADARHLEKMAIKGRGYKKERDVASRKEAQRNEMAGQLTECEQTKKSALRRPSWVIVLAGIGVGLLAGSAATFFALH